MIKIVIITITAITEKKIATRITKKIITINYYYCNYIPVLPANCRSGLRL